MNSQHRPRFYRDLADTTRWKTFVVRRETTDLFIRAERDLTGIALKIVSRLREDIRSQIERQPEFLTSLSPVPALPESPSVIEMMYEASEKAGVGPMAAVAGAVARCVGEELTNYSREIIVENGGDIWLKIDEPALLNLYCGELYFKGKIGIRIDPEKTPCGVCTSSARLSHSLSLGRADAATIIARDAALADAIATEACNMVKTEDDIESSVAYALDAGAQGAIVIFQDRMAIQGDIELADPEVQ